MRKLVVLGVVLAVAASAPADVLWDNNINADHTKGRAISPPGFPNIRVADDFIVPPGVTWAVEGFNYYVLDRNGWIDPEHETEVTVYSDDEGQPGREIAQTLGHHEKELDWCGFIGCDYIYWVELDEPFRLEPGTYWIGPRVPGGSGAGSNFWQTADGGPDGGEHGTKQVSYFSLDSGTTWKSAGPGWHHAFVITGREVPEPTSLLLLAFAGLAALRRRRRRL